MSISLIILDIDGVMTDGKKYYGSDGLPFAKTYCDKDFTAIKRFRGAGVPVCFLSGDENINLEMSKNRNIPFYSSRGKEKANFIDQLSSDFQSKPEEMVYIGDDLFDIGIMSVVGNVYCPSDACVEVKELCGTDNVLDKAGGDNVIVELFHVLLGRGLIGDCTINEIELLDKEEVF